MTHSEIVRKFLNGFNHPDQISESFELLADDYHFQNPLVKLNSKTAFIALAKQIGAVLTAIELIHVVTDGDWVATFYQFKSAVPGLETNTASEWFRVEDGLIRNSHLIYDTAEWRTFYAQLKMQ